MFLSSYISENILTLIYRSDIKKKNSKLTESCMNSVDIYTAKCWQLATGITQDYRKQGVSFRVSERKSKV